MDLEIGKRGPGSVQEHGGVVDLATVNVIIGVLSLDVYQDVAAQSVTSEPTGSDSQTCVIEVTLELSRCLFGNPFPR